MEKAVTKNIAKLLIKIADFVKDCEELYDIKLVYKDKVQMKRVKNLEKALCIKEIRGNRIRPQMWEKENRITKFY